MIPIVEGEDVTNMDSYNDIFVDASVVDIVPDEEFRPDLDIDKSDLLYVENLCIGQQWDLPNGNEMMNEKILCIMIT